jgi:hypothetical protein
VIYDEFKDGMWIIGVTRGSPAVATSKFEHRAKLTVGMLAVYGAVLYKGAIWRSRVQVILDAFDHRKGACVLRWDRYDGDNPSMSFSSSGGQPLPISSESVRYLKEVCFLEELTSMISQEQRTDLQDAIARSLYWFADAHRENNQTMRFVKLWTCAECFFAIEDEVTELNARGIATVLAFAGFQIIDLPEYRNIKRKLKSLYDLRSRAIHRAEFGMVDDSDLAEFSRWIAWVIISMTAISLRGYKTLDQVKEQVARLDSLSLTRVAPQNRRA